jgi:hypothetical protein
MDLEDKYNYVYYLSIDPTNSYCVFFNIQLRDVIESDHSSRLLDLILNERTREKGAQPVGAGVRIIYFVCRCREWKQARASENSNYPIVFAKP